MTRILLALLVAAAFAAPAADAAFAGRPGPIVYSRSHPGLNESDGIFAHGPRQAQTSYRLSAADTHGLAISPDGRSIAYAANVGFMYEEMASQIFVMNADGTGVRLVTNNAAYDSTPSFSPDGGRIVFTRRVGIGRTSVENIFSVNPDGSELRRLTFGPFSDSEPTFTPDGRRIVFVSNRVGGGAVDTTAIYSMRTDGSSTRKLIDTPGVDFDPDVSPDGRRILFLSTRDGGANIFVANGRGRRAQPLRGRMSCENGPCFFGPTWSPDGRHVAAIRWGSRMMALVVMRADGSGRVKRFVTARHPEHQAGVFLGPPAWAPRPGSSTSP